MNQLNYMGNFITFYDFDFFDRMSSDVGVFLFKLKKKIDFWLNSTPVFLLRISGEFESLTFR